MKKLHRFRRAEQLQFFNPRRVLPSWSNLPTDVRQAVTRLVAEMFLEHRVGEKLIQLERRSNDE